MKRARFTEEIIAVLKEHEAETKMADLARKHGVSEATIYNWKVKFSGMDIYKVKRLRALEEDAKLKKPTGRADARCGRTSRVAFKKMLGPAAKRAAVAQLQAVMSLSERRACSILGADRKMIRYRCSRPPDGSSAWPIARSRQGAAAFLLLPAVRPAAAGGRAIGNQPNLPALYREKASPSACGGPPQGRGKPCPNPGRGEAQRALGRWTSSTTISPMADASASSTSLTTSPRNAWAPFRRCRSRDGAWAAN